MKKILIGIGVLVVVLIAAAIILPFVIPAERYRDAIIGQVKVATGRDLTISGPMKFSLLPRLELEANKVAFSNAPGAADKQMATLDQLLLRLQIFPLLHGEVIVDSFVITDPVIHLEVDKQGRPNWEFAEAPKGAAPAQAAKPAASGGGGGGLSDIHLGDMRLVNGTITYVDDRTGDRQSIEKANLTLSLPDLDSPFKATGDLVWKAKKITLKADVAKLRAIMDGKTTDMALAIAAEPVSFDFKGTVTGGATSKLAGDIDLKVPSVRGLAAWAAKPIDAPGTGLGPLAIKGKLAAEGAKVSFSNADITLDAIKAKGELAIDAGGAKPYAKGRLDVDKLDINPYLPPEQPAAAGGGKASAPGAAPAQSAGWSNDPIDASGLRAANADFDLSTNAILVRKIQIGRSVLGLKLKDGVLTANLSELALYQGGGKGQLTVNGAGAMPAVDANFALSKVQAEPLLKDAMDFERLSGTAESTTTISTRGKSQREMISALQGKGAVTFTNGAIKGINIGAMIRNVSTAFLDSSAGKAQQTDFAELGGTYTITNGIVKNTDLDMKSPLLRVGGAGTVDLPQRSMNYRIEPKLAATTQGQGGKSDVSGLQVPVIISGPWDNLSYKPDLAGVGKQLLQNPTGAVDQLKGLGKGVVPGAAAGGAASGGAASGGTAPSGNPVNQLKGLLGK